ncbi:MAG: LVIVD repeat-containing protein, partial [Candidatus Thorarchaeota archaeon]
MKNRNNLMLSLGVLSLVLISLVAYANFMGAQAQTTLVDRIQENTDVDYSSMVPSELFINSLSEGLTKIGELDVDFGNAYRVSRFGNLLFIASLSGGVTFIDVTNQSNPIVKGNYWNGGEIYDAVYKNGYCYTANIQTGIEVLDYSDYDRIEKVSSYYDGTGQTKDLEFIGISTLYVADGSDGLEIFTLSPNGTIFTKIKTEKFGATEIISIRADPLNNIAFLMCGSAGVKVIDITRPTTPVLIKTLKDGTTNSRHADVSAKLLYVADGANGMKVYNYSDKTNIALLDQFTIGGGEYCEFFTWDVAKRAYMTTGNYLYQLNISDPKNVTEIWKISFTEGETKGLISVTSAIYLCNDFDFKIIDISDVDKIYPTIKSEITFAGEPSSTAVDGDIAVLVEGLTGVDFINITDPTEPTLISKLEKASTSFWDVEISGNYVYCATTQGLEVIDISDIYHPISVRTVTSGYSRYIAVSGNYAYLSTSAKDFVVIDITTPTLASEVTHLDLAALPRDIAVSGNYAYAAVATAGVQVIDISTPSTPTIATTISTSDAQGVAVLDDLLLIADTVDGV